MNTNRIRTAESALAKLQAAAGMCPNCRAITELSDDELDSKIAEMERQLHGGAGQRAQIDPIECDAGQQKGMVEHGNDR